MRKLICLLGLLVLCAACSGYESYEEGREAAKKTTPDSVPEESAEHADETHYTCPMHPEVDATDMEDKCPICGMDLVEKEAEARYACPMHPEETSNEAGKCGECGMDLVEVGESQDESTGHEDQEHSG